MKSGQIATFRELRFQVKMRLFDLPFEFSYNSFDDFIAAFMASTWSTNVIKNGVAAPSFTFESKITTPAGAKYHRLAGCQVNTMQLNVSSNEIVTGSFGFNAKAGTSATAILSGCPLTLRHQTTDFFEGANDFAITLGGSPISARSVSVSGTNNNRNRPVIGSKYTDGIGLGRFENRWSKLRAYFPNDSTLYDQFLADTYTTLQMVFTDPAAGFLYLPVPAN